MLERVIHNRAELDPLIELVKGWRAKLFGFGFPELTTGDFCDAVSFFLNNE